MYSVGFRDEDPEDDRPKLVSIRVRRPGMRAIHPSAFTFRSPQAKRESLIRAAYLSPELFESGVVRAHVFPLRPTSKQTWEGLLSLSFPVPIDSTAGKDSTREFGAVLQSGSLVVHRFSRAIRLEPNGGAAAAEPLVTFLEPVDLRPGTYTVTAVVNDPKVGEPHAVKVDVEVPEIPRREFFLVGPVLGRRAGGDLVVRSGRSTGAPSGQAPAKDSLGDWNSFQPLLVRQVDEPTELVAITLACVVGKPRRDAPSHVLRSFRSGAGHEVGHLEPVVIALEGEGTIRCQNLLDVLPARAMGTGGEFLFEAALDLSVEADRETIRFSVGAPRPRGLSAPTAGISDPDRAEP